MGDHLDQHDRVPGGPGQRESRRHRASTNLRIGQRVERWVSHFGVDRIAPRWLGGEGTAVVRASRAGVKLRVIATSGPDRKVELAVSAQVAWTWHNWWMPTQTCWQSCTLRSLDMQVSAWPSRDMPPVVVVA
jgi:hypothetical protein